MSIMKTIHGGWCSCCNQQVDGDCDKNDGPMEANWSKRQWCRRCWRRFMSHSKRTVVKQVIDGEV